MLDKELKIAIKLAQTAGKKLRAHFGHLRADQIAEKGPRDLVTELDKTIEQDYVTEIKKAFPGDGILGEEGAKENPQSRRKWVIDPLDGTKNYVNGVPFYGTALCLIDGSDVVLSLIYEPATDRLYYALKGQGAYGNNQRIQVSKQQNLKESTILYCHARREEDIAFAERYVSPLKKLCLDAVRLRSASCEMSMVARGSAEAYAMNGLPLWDLAAGALLVQEAGGKTTDFAGKPWQPGMSNILVSNGTEIHDKILAIIKKFSADSSKLKAES